MILTDSDCKLEIVPVEQPGDVRLAVSVRAQAFSGSYDEVWLDRARLEAFASDLRRLEAERSGEAVLESWSPGEFRLSFRVVDGSGHVGAEVILTRHQYGRFRRHPNTVGCDLEVAGEDLARLIDEFEEEFGVG